MSLTISISPTADDTWIIRNAVYRWLVNRIADVHPDRSDVVERLTISGYNGGVALEHYLDEYTSALSATPPNLESRLCAMTFT